MSRFYLLLWGKWAIRLSLTSLLLTLLFTLLITGSIYANQGFRALSDEVYQALYDIFVFWFAIVWNVALLVSLFEGLKHLFNSCSAGYKLELFSCEKEEKQVIIKAVGLGDLVKVWRKWFMLLIWLVGAQMILAVVFNRLFSSDEMIFSWFNIYVLYAFILVAGFFSFVVFSARCKRVRIAKC